MRGKLIDLIKNIEVLQSSGDMNIEISGLETDSRQIQSNHIFVAIKGVQVDGHNYIQNAIQNGATVIIYDEPIEEQKKDICYIQVANTVDILGILAKHWYNDPSASLKLVGVTGTNGKTTTATLLYKMHQELGYETGLISTVANYVGKKEIETSLTTPDVLTINKLLREMVDIGCEYAFMEVSSHAIVQQRISGLNFKGGIFTNLTQDHLDYHHTMAEYLKAKKTFFDNLPKGSFALYNSDDKNGSVMVQNTKADKYSYTVKSLGDFKAKIIEKRFDSTSLEVNDRELDVQFVGTFNVYNLLAVYGSCILLGHPVDETLLALSTMKPVSGRFETLQCPDGYTAVIDYAHTPDALTNVLNAIHDVLNGEAKVITVVGCGGNRDKTKRPIMAQEAFKGSDQLVITSDNPRFEEPMAIINDMADGLTKEQLKNTLLIEDRKQAIKIACKLANSGDVILIAGKGHENYQDIKGVKNHFSDKEIILEIINN